MSRSMSIQFSTISRDHQQVALFQTKAQFWAYFVGAWVTFALGLIPIAFLLMMPPQPFTLKITAVCLSISFEMFSLSFARNLKQTRKWVDDHYDRLREDERMLQAQQLVDSIEDHELRDKMRAEMAQRLFTKEFPVGDGVGPIRTVLRCLRG